MENKIPFKRKAQQIGNTIWVSIPEEIANYLEFKKGDELTIIVDSNKKKEKYVSVYKEEEGDKKE